MSSRLDVKGGAQFPALTGLPSFQPAAQASRGAGAAGASYAVAARVAHIKKKWRAPRPCRLRIITRIQIRWRRPRSTTLRAIRGGGASIRGAASTALLVGGWPAAYAVPGRPAALPASPSLTKRVVLVDGRHEEGAEVADGLAQVLGHLVLDVDLPAQRGEAREMKEGCAAGASEDPWARAERAGAARRPAQLPARLAHLISKFFPAMASELPSNIGKPSATGNRGIGAVSLPPAPCSPRGQRRAAPHAPATPAAAPLLGRPDGVALRRRRPCSPAPRPTHSCLTVSSSSKAMRSSAAGRPSRRKETVNPQSRPSSVRYASTCGQARGGRRCGLGGLGPNWRGRK